MCRGQNFLQNRYTEAEREAEVERKPCGEMVLASTTKNENMRQMIDKRRRKGKATFNNPLLAKKDGLHQRSFQ